MRIAILSWLFSLFALTGFTYAEEPGIDKLLDLLKGKDLITIDEAAGLRAELAIKEQEEKEGRKWFSILGDRPLTINGYAQLRYQNFEEDGKDDGFDIRRLRLDIRGNITEKWDYRAQTEFGGSDVKLLDVMMSYKLIEPYVTITGGQFKIPFSPENLTSSGKLLTINRSQVVEALVSRSKDVIGNQNGRDIGVLASGNFLSKGDRHLFNYAIGIFNGAGINTSDNNENKDFAGRLVFYPLKNLGFGANYYNGTSHLDDKDQNRDRVGADFTYVHKALSLSGEYIIGEDDKTDKDGWYLMGGYYAIPGKLQGVVKFDTFDPDTKVDDNETDVYTFGVNYYFDKWAVMQINYEFKNERGNEVDNNALLAELTLRF